MSVKIRVDSKTKKIYLDIIQNRKHKWENTGLTITGNKATDKEQMKLAETLRAIRESQIVSGEWNLLDPVNGKKGLLEYAKENIKGKRTHLYRACLYIEKYKDGNIKLIQITPKWIEDFQDWLLNETELKQTTASHYVSAIRYILKKAVRDKMIPNNPAEMVKGIPLLQGDKRPLTQDELQRLIDEPIGGVLGGEVKQAFLFLCFTGLRISDLKKLKWSQIVVHSNGEKWIEIRQQKTKKPECTPLSQNAWNIIKPKNAMPMPTAYVFPTLATTNTNCNSYLRPWGERCGISKKDGKSNVSWHTARHTFATQALQNGADIRTVSKLLGHTKLQTTLVYAEATDELKEKAVNALPDYGIELNA